jgi:hypothetical protein
MGYFHINLPLKISKDRFIQLSSFGQKVSFDAGHHDSKTQVEWLIGKLGLLDDCFVAGCLEHDLDICWLVLARIQSDGVVGRSRIAKHYQ